MGTVVAEVFDEDAIPQEAVIESEVEDDEEHLPLPTLDPRTVIPKGDSFLNSYMDVAMKHPTPPEFHLFLGLQALGLTAGNRVQLADDDNVKGNLPLIFLGDTTAGKSRATRPMINNILTHSESVLRHHRNNLDGVKIISGAGSGEYLIEEFEAREPDIELRDNAGNVISTEIGQPRPISGMVFFNELSLLSAKSSGPASAFKPIMMSFLDGDTYVENGTRGKGKVSAYMPFGSLLTTTQPKDLKNTLSRSDMAKGLVNRFLFVCGTGRPAPAIGKTILDWSEPRKKLEEIHNWSHQVGTYNNCLAIDQWETGALERFEDFYEKRILPTKILDSKSGSGVLGRIDLHMKRLVLLFAINDMSTIIRMAHVEATEKLFDYLLDCFAVVSGRVVSSEVSEALDKIIEVINKLEAQDIACSKRELYDRRLKRYGMTSDVWANAMRTLLSPGGGLYRNTSARKDGRGGRKTETFNTYKGA